MEQGIQSDTLYNILRQALCLIHLSHCDDEDDVNDDDDDDDEADDDDVHYCYLKVEG